MTSAMHPKTAPTVWLLDVDDTINGWEAGWTDGDLKIAPAETPTGRTVKIRYSQQLINRIIALHRTGTVQVVWSSIWCDDISARNLESALGLPIFDTAFTTPQNRFVGDLKLAAAMHVLAQGRRLIWTDDAEIPAVGTGAHRQLTDSGNALLIAPKANHCLRPADMDTIEAFAALGAHSRC